MAAETTPLVVEEDVINYAPHLKVLELMGCRRNMKEVGGDSHISISSRKWRLPHIDIRQEVATPTHRYPAGSGDSHTSISGRKWRLPHIDIRQEVECANEFDTGSMQRIENVFLRGINAWICMLLPNLKVKCDADMRMSSSIQSAVAAI